VESLYKEYKGEVQFFLVYTREIHPSRGKPRPSSAAKRKPPATTRPSRRRPGPAVTQHASIEDRMIAADKCMKGLKLTIPTLLDSMDNAFTKAFSGIPAGTTVVDIDGRIAYWNRGAPGGAKPDKARAAIQKLLAKGGGAIPAKWAKVRVPPAPAGKDKPDKPAKVGKPDRPTKDKAAPEPVGRTPEADAD